MELKIVTHHHTWTGQHIVCEDGITRLMPVQLGDESYWTCSVSTEKYIYRSKTKCATEAEAIAEAEADFIEYAPRFEPELCGS